MLRLACDWYSPSARAEAPAPSAGLTARKTDLCIRLADGHARFVHLAAGKRDPGRGPSEYSSGVRLAPQETRTYFVTSVTAQHRRLFQVTANAALLQQTILDYRAQGRFLLHAFVIMPDHFHALITPAADVSLEKAMQFIKGGFSFRLKSKQDVWMRSFNETQIMSAEKFRSCMRYIEENPVRKGLVSKAEDFEFSSANHGEVDAMPGDLRD